MTTITNEIIAKLESKGFNRWTKGNMDRLYINAKDLGLEVDYYKTGNVSSATWQGEHISNADARRLLESKVWIDVKTGELHVNTSFDLFDAMSVEEAAQAYIDSIIAPEDEPEATAETDETYDGDVDYREEFKKAVAMIRRLAADWERERDAANSAAIFHAEQECEEALERDKVHYERYDAASYALISALEDIAMHSNMPEQEIIALGLREEHEPYPYKPDDLDYDPMMARLFGVTD